MGNGDRCRGRGRGGRMVEVEGRRRVVIEVGVRGIHTRAIKHDSIIEQQKLRKTGRMSTSRKIPSCLRD